MNQLAFLNLTSFTYMYVYTHVQILNMHVCKIKAILSLEKFLPLHHKLEVMSKNMRALWTRGIPLGTGQSEKRDGSQRNAPILLLLSDGFDAIQDHIKFSPAVFPKKLGMIDPQSLKEKLLFLLSRPG